MDYSGLGTHLEIDDEDSVLPGYVIVGVLTDCYNSCLTTVRLGGLYYQNHKKLTQTSQYIFC